jgi:glutamate-1-semialdehyde 2,1-aminomutase
LLDAAARVVPGGVNTCRRKIDPPLCARRGYGAYIEDMDGRRYLDYHAAYGAVVLGHAYPEVNERVHEVVRDGVLFGVGSTPAEVAVAEKIVAHVPSVEEVLLCNSGSEATLHLIRLARAVTGRQKLLKFQGCYHGFHDYVLRNVLSAPDRIGKRDPGSAGMLEAAVDATLVCRYNDSDDVEATLAANEGEVAAVIVEPIAHNAPAILPREGFLERLRELCDASGALLIFDEIITGFRHHLGGFQAIAGVRPDLTAMGKAIGNGFPIAAIGGPRELMERFNTTAGGTVFYGGTYSGNSVGSAAALATIEVMEREDVHGHVFKLGEQMRAGLREIADELSIPAVVSGYGGIYVMSFMDGPLESYDDAVRNDSELQVRYRAELIRRGVFEMPESSGRNHISYSHTEDDVARTLDVAREAMKTAASRHATSGSPR